MDTVCDEMLEEIARRVISTAAPEKVFLFGSRASGSATENSDVDLMVIVPNGTECARSLKRRIRESLLDIFVPIDIVIEPASLFERRCHVPASLEHRVATCGKKLYG